MFSASRIQVSVVQNVGSAMHRVVIFQLLQKSIKTMTLGILNLQQRKGDLNLEMLNFNMGFTSYQTNLESLKKSLSGR